MTPDTKRALEWLDNQEARYGHNEKLYPDTFAILKTIHQALTAPAVEKIEGLDEAVWNVEKGHVGIEEFKELFIRTAKAYSRIQNQEGS